MEPRYYLLGNDGRPYGPAETSAVRAWIREGRLNQQSLANLAGSPNWQPLGSFAEFAPDFAPPPLQATRMASPPVQLRHTHPLAVTGFVFGLLSLTCCFCCFGEVLSVVAIALSGVAFVEIGREPDRYDGRVLAILGMVLGGLGLVLGLVGTLAGFAGSLVERHNFRPHR